METKPNYLRWLFRIGVGVCVLAVLLLVGRLLLKSSWMLDYVSGKLVDAVHETTGAEVHLGDLRGDLAGSLLASNFTISKNDTLLHVDSLRIRYTLMSLFYRTIDLSVVKISGVRVHLEQDTRGVWSFEQYLPEKDSLAAEPESGDSGEPGFLDKWRIRINQLHITDGSATISAPSLLPDGPAAIRDLALDGSYTQLGESFDVAIRDLSLKADGLLLPDQLALEVEADADEEEFHLARLFLTAGKTRLLGQGRYDLADSTAQAEIQAKPLAAETVNALSDSLRVYDDLDIDLRINGSVSRPAASVVVAQAGGRLIFEASVKAENTSDGLVLTELIARSSGLDLPELVAIPETELPRLGSTEIRFAGRMPISEPQQMQGSLSLASDNVAYQTYRLGRVQVDGDMDKVGGRVRARLQTGANRADVEFAIRDPFAEQPTWNVNARARIERLSQVDLSQELQLIMRGDVRASGMGFDPNTARAQFTAQIHDAVIDSQAVESVYVRGRLQGDLFIDSSLVVLGGGSRVWADGRTTLDFEEPVYQLKASTHGFNVSEINGLEALNTRITAQFSLNGVCFSEDLRKIEAHLKVDSSWVNNTLVDSLRAHLVLDRNLLSLTQTSLNSDIADGRFAGKMRIDSLYFPDNNLEFQLKLKNLQPLAEIAGAQRLGAVGEIRGRIEDSGSGPQLVAIVAVDDIVYDSTEVRRVVGQYTMDIREQPAYLAELDILGPFVSGIRFQDIRLTSRGRFQPQGAMGTYGIEANLQENSGLLIQGNYTKEADSLFFESSAFDIRGSLRTYSQAQPFSLAIRDGVITSDTLRLEAPPDASLELHLRHFDSDSVALALAIDRVNAQALQESVMEEAIVRGTITGYLDLAYTAQLFQVDADVAVANFGMGAAKLDSIKLVAQVGDEQLEGSLLIRDRGYDLLTASLDVPFRLGNPTEFDEAFFEQPVRGKLTVPRTDLLRYEDLFKELNMPPITGVVSANSTLRGIAGIPVFDGSFTFENGRVANIPVDRFDIGWLYDQAKHRIDIKTTLNATGQRALVGEASISINLDLRNFEAILPKDTDPVSGSIVADQFNLALLNPFIPIDVADNLKGSVNGRVEIGGTFGEPDIQGRVNLTGGTVMVVPANMEFRNIQMSMRLQSDRFEIEEMSMRGGSGNMQASGYLTLDGFTPDRINVHIESKDFRVMNTRDIEAALTMNATLGGTYILPELRGSVSLSNGNIFLDNFGDRSVEDVRLDSAETVEKPSFYDSLTIRLRVQLEPNVWLRNRSSPELALELEGDMDLLKEKNGELQAFGSLSTRQGYAMQYGKRFQVQRGDLSFNGDIANPQMDIVAVYELRVPEDIEISYLIGGTLEDPTFDFRSNPEMELENIISYTLFGKPFGALFSWQQSFSGGGGGNDLARDAAIGILVDRVEALATEALGIDLLQIDTNRQGESTTTSVKAGKYITDKLFVAVLNELGGSDAITRVVLEYYVRRNLQFILTQGNDRRSGFDVRWKYEY